MKRTITPTERPSKTRSGGTFYGAVGPYTKDTANSGSLTDHYTIFFPAMPEELELARSSNYKVTSNQVLPDGIHWYQATEPLSVPVSFDLHAYDKDYCKQGPLTILRTCAILHALILPVRTSAVTALTQAAALDTAIAANTPTPSKTDDTTADKNAKDNSDAAKADSGEESIAQLLARAKECYTAKGDSDSEGNDTSFAFPPPCWLRLIEGNPYSVQLSGYIKDVRVRLKGPWLTATQGSTTHYNLPTAAHFEFTFVNCPCHTNDWSDGLVITSAFLQDVSNFLYDSQSIREKFTGTGVAIDDITLVDD